MNSFPCLFADAGDIITIIVFAVGGLIWLVNQIIKAGKGMQPPPQQRRMNPPGNPEAPPVPRPAAQKVDDEIEAFLRRAAQARAGGNPPPAQPRQQPQPGQPPRPGPQRGQPGPAPRPAQPPRLSQGKPPPRPPATSRPRTPVVAVEVIEEGAERLASVEQHVAQHMDTRGFSERASHMTTVDQADEQMDERIHQSLDHSVGALTAGSAAGGPVTATQQSQRSQLSTYAAASAGLAVVLADPQNLRQAIILNEVLRRPDFDF